MWGMLVFWEGDINSGPDIRWEGGRQRWDHVKEMIGILDMGEEGFDKGLEVGVDVCRDTFGGGAIGRDDGMAGVTGFVYFGLKVQGGGVELGVEE